MYGRYSTHVTLEPSRLQTEPFFHHQIESQTDELKDQTTKNTHKAEYM